MKATGIIRKVDELGRLVLPSELRKIMNIKTGDPIEVFTEGETIVLKKYKAANECVITGEVTDSNEEVNGLVFSPTGAKLAIEALKEKFGGK